ncbi:glycosyltransferase family 4 protein [Thermostaphylospora chromogena]|uniref:Glycosyltransferase involved in cell wall bisynthesis n=1 Tax=Thermostaphylospora chromogena TaxID=35622 RepID=A0A1H1CSM6_9ACTN|nr:glycosyltransferase family 4 protein [Thermostaphylospora chromogena]SDQ67210.1 Glycosyltransferase involved in cell wall bisynthesis [Thermostaphylospora chromogena]
MKIVFLIQNLYGIGGTIRSTVNLTAALADRHEVEIVSVLRGGDRPDFSVDPRVTVRDLVDLRPGSPAFAGDDPRHAEPSRDFLRGDWKGYPLCSRLTDERMAAYLAECDADVVVATRPGLIGYLAAYGTDHYVKVGQEHLIHDGHSPRLQAELREPCAALDALVTVSEADAEVYRRKMPLERTRVVSIPNGVPDPGIAPATLDNPVIVAAGRLIPTKRYNLLIESFAKVAVQRPEWTLRLYGRGGERNALLRLIDELDLNGRAFLMGPRSPIEAEWVKGSIAAVSSGFESFGMTIVEAMRCGVPVVSTDCPYGPREIISDGRDGVLVRQATPSAMADALLRLIDDEPLRRAMGAAALRNARRFAPERVAHRYEQLFEECLAARGRTARTRRGPAQPYPTSTGPASQPEQTADDAGTDTRPAAPRRPLVAHSTVDGDGVTIRFAPGVLPSRAAGRFTLLLRSRDKGEHELILLPAGEAAVQARLRYDLHDLAEGRWDVYLSRPGKRPRRVTAGLCDTRTLVAARPSPHRPFRVWIPYATEQGNLAVHVWNRTVHAEVTDLVSTSAELAVRGVLINRALDPDVATLVLLRRHTDGEPVEVPVRAGADGEFRCAVPYLLLVAACREPRQVWDLYLRPDADGGLIRLGRLFNDVIRRRAVDRYRARQIGDAVVRPRYTTGNELSIGVVVGSAPDDAPHDVPDGALDDTDDTDGEYDVEDGDVPPVALGPVS